MVDGKGSEIIGKYCCPINTRKSNNILPEVLKNGLRAYSFKKLSLLIFERKKVLLDSNRIYWMSWTICMEAVCDILP